MEPRTPEAEFTPAQKMEMVADAELVTRRVYDRAVSGATQKAVLAVIAAYEGHPLSGAGIAPRACMSLASARLAAHVLVEQRVLVRRNTGYAKLCMYAINWERVREIQTEEPANFGPGGRRMTRGGRRAEYQRTYSQHRRDKKRTERHGEAAA